MVSSIGASVFFGIAVLALYAGAFLWEKEEERVSALEWAVILAVLLGCYHTLAAGILDLVHLPVNIWTVGVCDLFPAGFFWWRIIKKKQRQKYEFKIVDGIFLAGLALGIAYIARVHYAGTALLVNYASVDAGVHFRTAMDVVNSQTITSMFHDTVWNALLIEFLGPLTTVDYYYRWYVLGELVNLALSGAVFYAIARRYMKDWFTMAAGVVLSGIYLVAYPLNSTLFGFSYLGMCVTVIGMLIAVTDLFLKDRLNRWFAIGAMMLGCLAVFESYVLFVPVVFFSVIFCIFRKQLHRKKLFSGETVMICLAVFLIPCIIGLWYSYRGIFSDGVTVTSAIANEGGCYRELFSNFLFFLPGGILGYVGLCKKRENRVLVFLTPLLLVFTLALFVQTLNGSVSSYYYYKLYFPIWLVLLALNFYGVVYAAGQTRGVIASVIGVWCAMVVFCLFSVEAKIQNKAPLMVQTNRAVGYVDIISFNYTYLHLPGYSPLKLDLYHYAYQELLAQGEETVPAVIDHLDTFWFIDVTDQRFRGWDYSSMMNEELYQRLEETGCNYIVVLKDNMLYVNDQEYFDSLERVYENEAGFVAKYRPKQ